MCRDYNVTINIKKFASFLRFCYQCFASSKLRAIVQNLLTFKDTQIAHKRFTSFPKFCYLVTLTCLFLGITENTIFDYQFLAMGKKRKPEASILEVSYINYFQHWHVILPVYNPVATVILMILIKIGTWGWIHIDTICIILCRALWEKLKGIEEMVESTLSPDSANVVELERVLCTELFETNQKSRQPVSSAQRIWDSYQEEYEKVSQLVEQVESYICPLILACFAGNIYIVVILLFNWIGPLSGSQSSKEQFIRVWFSFFQYSFRVAAITHFAGEVHQQSARILRQIQKCPQSVYSVSVERLERMLVGNPTGISLMGSFYITRKYFISIISFIFTTEIVLLQTYSSYYASAKENDS